MDSATPTDLFEAGFHGPGRRDDSTQKQSMLRIASYATRGDVKGLESRCDSLERGILAGQLL